VAALCQKKGVHILPVDSEHAALHQSLAGHRHEDVVALHLTASGGPFLRKSLEEMARATAADALKHPRWTMGAKITIDSATLMNKGLEVIEARWLFDISADAIHVIVHPQSIVHSLVEYRDGCMVAQLGVPDMRAPIAYALAWPERVESGVERLRLAAMGDLTFEEPDGERFPCLGLAYAALEAGGTMPAVLNAANEVAVATFLTGKLDFMDIPRLVENVMTAHDPHEPRSIEDILEADRWAREKATNVIRGSGFGVRATP
jgi:1-deoxy-D-xylulose-5-phosphate reductoisomerase